MCVCERERTRELKEPANPDAFPQYTCAMDRTHAQIDEQQGKREREMYRER